MKKIGLIAGNKRFPIVFSEAAKRKNYYIVAIAIKNDTLLRLKRYVNKIYWLGLSEFSKLFEIFKKEGITDVVMAGQISPHRLFSKEVARDEQIKDLLSKLRDKKADTIFAAVADRLKEKGFQLLNSTIFLEDYLPQKGTLTHLEPNFSAWEDVYFGLNLAKAIASLDIGQTVAVKDRAIVAVEALEGTDNLIRRAARIAREGIIVVKVSKPNQDMRFDIPVVGLNTVKNLVKVNATCLAIEADKTLFIDKEEAVRLADKNNISIVAV